MALAGLQIAQDMSKHSMRLPKRRTVTALGTLPVMHMNPDISCFLVDAICEELLICIGNADLSALDEMWKTIDSRFLMHLASEFSSLQRR